MGITKKLNKQGNGHALYIDKAILELIGANADTKFDISTTDGRSLLLTPIVDEKRDRKVQNSLAKVNKRYGKALEKLAE